MKTIKIVIAGVGGQGTLLASRLLAEASVRSGFNVKIGETYGMAQRGGPVMGHVQIGGKLYNPQILKGDADILIGFEPAEAVRRGVTYLKKGGFAIVNTRILSPVEVISGMVEYPSIEKMFSLLYRITENITKYDATKIAEEAGDPISTNIVMLGTLVASDFLPFDEKTVVNTIKSSIRPQYIELNMKAFELGKNMFKKQ